MDAVSHILAHPDLYLVGSQVEPSELATRLTGDALLLGATRTMAVHQECWWFVAADVDWLGQASLPVDELFRRIVPFPHAGPNSMRSEVLIGAFAEQIVTWRGREVSLIKGNGHAVIPTLPIALKSDWQRIVGYQLTPARVGGETIGSAVVAK